MRKLTHTLAVACCLAWMAGAHADDKELAQAIAGASQDLAQNEWKKAQHELDKARADFKQSQDAELRAQYGFYSALVNHQCADDDKVPKAERTRARTAAIAGYKQYLETHPKSGGALNNLAKLYAQDPSQREWALELYDQAVAVGDSRTSAYQLNRAKLQSEMGLNDAALKSSTDALKKDWRNSAAQDLSLALLEKSGDTEGIGRFIRALNDAGDATSAIDTAVREIDRLTAKREPLLIALADALANPVLQSLPAEFAGSATAKTLARHGEGADIGAGVRELLQFYAQPENARSVYWWDRDFNDDAESQGWFRGTTLLNLARALGDRCRRAGKRGYACAEAYYKFALEFAAPRPEPNSFLALAQIYGTTGRRDQIADIERRYEAELFSGKGDAIARQDKRKEYEFHLALGTMYSYLDKWQDPRWEPASAIYQLENAKRVADQYNRANPGKEQLKFPSESAQMLSDGYMKTGNYNKAARVRIEAAKKAADAGDHQGARELIDKKWMATLPGKADPEVIDQVGTVYRSLPPE